MKPQQRAGWGDWRSGTALAPLLVLTLAGCPSQPTVVPSRNLDRPTDMTIGCMGYFKEGDADRISGRPMAECHPPGKTDPPPDTAHRTFGFVTNTARGELSVIDLDKSRLVDLDPEVTGFNTVPLGVLPEAMAISDDGCRVVTANRGSCDLSVVDPGELMLPKLKLEVGGENNLMSNPAGVVTTVTIKGTSAAGVATELKVAPYEVQFLPQNVKDIKGDALLCPVGAGTPAKTPGAWRALVTFPSCDLVAMVDLPSGNIIDSVFVRAASDGKSVVLEPGGANPTCPFVDCGLGPRRMPSPPDAGTEAGASTDAASDGGMPMGAEAGAETAVEAGADGLVDGGGAETVSADGGDASTDAAVSDAAPPIPVMDDPFIGPGPLGTTGLAIHPDGSRVYVALANASFVARIPIATANLGPPLAGGASIYLHEGALGSNRIRLSVDPYNVFDLDLGLYGKFVGEGGGSPRRRYLYVIARDGTVRVIHVDGSPEIECDTNVDPRKLLDAQRTTACFPVDPTMRKPLAIGPGITLPALPRDVTFADLKLGDPDELAADGAFAFVLTSSGSVYLVNIDPTLRKTKGVVNGVAGQDVTEPQPLVNTLRDGNVISYSRALAAPVGPARLDILPVAPPTGPRLEGFFATDSIDNATALGTAVPTFVFFPDRSAVASQTWSITWEGPLFPDPRYSAKITPVTAANGTPVLESVVRDRGGAFCRLGVMPGDIVTLEGCADNSQCGIGQVCVASAAAGRTAGGLPIKGLCLSPLAAEQERQKALCRGLQESIRRYEVVRVHPTELVIRPRVDELVKTPLDQCTKDADCAPSGDPAHKGFTCVDKRCVKSCAKKVGNNDVIGVDEECRAGRKCVDFGGKKFLCADGPEVVEGCFEQLTAYRVHAGRSFLVRGNVSTAPSTTLTVPDPDPGRFKYPNPDPQICVEDPSRKSVSPTRIPMNSPQCNNIMGVDTLDSRAPAGSPANTRLLGEIAHSTPDPNPCLYKGGPIEGDPPGVTDRTHTRALFQNAEVRFIISNLEQPFADATEIRFDVHGGFRPHSVAIPPDTIDIGMPARILVSPLPALDGPAPDPKGVHELPYLFVVDQRRLGRTRGSTATRGQVLRIHPQGPFQRQPIYQDFSASGGLYPIQ